MNNGIPNNTPEKNIKVSCQFTDRQQPRYARPYRAHGLFGASVGVPRKKTRRRRHVGNQAQHTFMERC